MSTRRVLLSSAIAAVTLLAVGCVSPGVTVDQPPSTGTVPADIVPGRLEVVPIFITTQTPKFGLLTFDGLAAGDPQAARDGRLVVFLHGFPSTAESYREILPTVAAAGYYAVAVNQRGYSPGARPEPVEAYNIVELVGDVGRVADALGATTFHLVGHDWGGAVAWVFSALMPDRISGLTVLSTPHPDALSDGIADSTNPQHQRSAYMNTLAAPGSEDRLLEDGADTFTAVFGAGDSGALADLSRDVGGVPPDKLRRYAERLATPDALRAALNWYRANPLPIPMRLGPTKVSTVYLWGADDRAFVRATAEATASHVEGPYTFQELTGKDHWLPDVAPEEVASAVLRQLAAERATRPG